MHLLTEEYRVLNETYRMSSTSEYLFCESFSLEIDVTKFEALLSRLVRNVAQKWHGFKARSIG